MKTLKLKSILLGLTLMLGFTIMITSCEQEQLTEVVNHEKTSLKLGTNDYSFNGLKLSENTKTKRKGATYFRMDKQAFTDLLSTSPKRLNFTIPSPDNPFELELEQWDVFDIDAKVKKTGVFYRGTTKNDPNSIVAVSVFDEQLNVKIIGADETYTLKNEGKDLMAFYKASHDKHDSYQSNRDIACQHEHNDTKIITRSSNDDQGSSDCTSDIRIQYTLDFTFIDYFGSDAAALQYLTTQFNVVKSIYYNDAGIPLMMTTPNLLTESQRLEVADGNPNNLLSVPMDDFQLRFGALSDEYDVQAAVVAIERNGELDGTGLGVWTDNCDLPPICQKGSDGDEDCLPMSITALNENNDNSGTTDDDYFTYVLAHELGHNFGIRDSDNDDLMDHGTGSQHHLDEDTAEDMRNLWEICYACCSSPTLSDITYTEHSSRIYIYAQPYHNVEHEFEYKLSGDAEWTSFGITTSHYNTIKNKECDVTYQVRLRRMCGTSWSGWSPIKEIKTC